MTSRILPQRPNHPVSLNDARDNPDYNDGCGFIVARCVVAGAALAWLALLLWRAR